MKDTINIKRTHVYAAIVFLVVISLLLIFKPTSSSIIEVSALEEKFNSLNSTNTNFCAGPQILDTMATDNLQGACCGEMDFHRYVEQLEGLKKFSDIEQIPKDPYDIPVSLAEELLGYQKTIALNARQQEIYDKAIEMSHEGGPCCCKCWRWYAFEGLAKYLIVKHNFNAEQTAEVWDLEDGCGGPGHVEGESDH